MSPAARTTYQIALPVMLILWLLPLLGVALTSVRPSSDLAQGNYFGVPSYLAFSNYLDVFRNSPFASYMLNSFRVTIPTVIGAVALSCLTGYALAVYRFRGNLIVFFLFVAGNFVPFQILMVPYPPKSGHVSKKFPDFDGSASPQIRTRFKKVSRF